MIEKIRYQLPKRGQKTSKRGQKILKGGTENVTLNQQKILDSIAKNQNITIGEMSISVGMSLSKIKANIAKLKQKGLLQRIGSYKGGYWKIINRD